MSWLFSQRESMILSRSDQKCSQALPSLIIVVPGPLKSVLAALVTFLALFHIVLHLYALYWYNTDLICLFSSQLTSAQLEHKNFGLHSCPSPPPTSLLGDQTVIGLQHLLLAQHWCFFTWPASCPAERNWYSLWIWGKPELGKKTGSYLSSCAGCTLVMGLLHSGSVKYTCTFYLSCVIWVVLSTPCILINSKEFSCFYWNVFLQIFMPVSLLVL